MHLILLRQEMMTQCKRTPAVGVPLTISGPILFINVREIKSNASGYDLC